MSYSVEDTIKILEGKFQNIKFNFKEFEFGGYIPIFFISPKDSKSLEKYWVEISNTIAIDYQARLQDEFRAWNIYLFFITNFPIKKELKYKIENDTFSSRKIVVENNVDENLMINEHIINIITVSNNQNEVRDKKFTPNKILNTSLKDKILKKERVTKTAGEAYQELLEELKTSENEI
ncbi:ABC-three component system middle component 1 [Gaetbulibacter sp. M235]|uniref:ABC-three component system middle component 1 n=1 Tax=Gaetbulibacter sp. M235 TaxID=3126510 RepID=UPI00374ED636